MPGTDTLEESFLVQEVMGLHENGGGLRNDARLGKAPATTASEPRTVRTHIPRYTEGQ
jgi:hypothetical protein